MRIFRNGVGIDLTDDELESAYREKELNLRATEALDAIMLYNLCEGTEYWPEDNDVLERMAEEYIDKDHNVEENPLWRTVVEEFLTELGA